MPTKKVWNALKHTPECMGGVFLKCFNKMKWNGINILHDLTTISGNIRKKDARNIYKAPNIPDKK